MASTQPGTNNSSLSFSELDNIFVDWAIDNHGDVPTETDFIIEVRVDGQTLTGYLVDFPLDLETALYDEDVPVGRLTAGLHEIQLVVDSTNTIDELNEGDNAASKFIGVAPANDDRSRAITISHGQAVAQTDTRFATTSLDDPQPTCRTGLDGHTVWYRYVTTADGVLTVDTSGSNYDTVLSVYTNLLQELACNDNASLAQVDSRLQLNVEQGRTYFIQVGSFGATAGGTLVLNTAFLAGRPNLEFVQPAGWSNKIVVSLEPGTNTDSAVLTFGDRPYVDFAVINSGTVSLNGSFVVTLNVQQGVQRFNVTRNTPLAPGEVFVVEDVQLAPIPSGPLSFEVVADSFSTILEANENDNVTTRQIEVNFIPGTIRGQVYRDRNADGALNAGDEVLPNWTVFLDQDGAPGLTLGDRVSTTDGGGSFEFTGLRPGLYSVGEVVPAGWLSTNIVSPGFVGVSVFDGQTSSVSLGNVKRNELSGLVFFDLNSNGVRDQAEPAAAGVRIYADLDHSEDFTVVGRVSGEPFVETSADGTYDFYAGPFGFGFRSLFGSYSVRVDTSQGLGVTMPSSGQGYPVVVPGDDTVITSLNFGIIQANEAPIANMDEVVFVEDAGPFLVTGNLLTNDVDPDSRFQPLSIVPSPFGVGGVGNLQQMQYGALLVQADGTFTFTMDNTLAQGLGHGIVRHDDRAYWISDGQLVRMGVFRVTITGANDAPTIISGGGGETASVSIPENVTGFLQMNATDVDVGDSLTYTIMGGADQAKFTIDPVFRDLAFVDAPDFENPTDTNTDNIYEVIVQVSDGHPGGIDVQRIFVQVTDVTGTGYITGRHFEDMNGDGAWQESEPVLASQTVYVDFDANGTMDAAEPRMSTDSSGRYFFGNLQAGIYQVVAPQQAGWVSTTPRGPNPLSTARSVIVREGQVSEGADLGTFKLGEIRGRVFNDVNADRVKQDGEAAMAGWTVYVDANANGRQDAGEANVQTDASGAYVLSNVGPGTHQIREDLLSHWGTTAPADGAQLVAMTSGLAATGRDLGVVLVTLDVDGDGTVSPFTDGRLMARYLANAPLTPGISVGVGALRSSESALNTFLGAAAPLLLDVDGNGQRDMGTDGRLITRYLAGLSDTQLTAGNVVGSGATRSTAEAIRSILDSFQPAAPQVESLTSQSSVLGPVVPMGLGATFAIQTSASSDDKDATSLNASPSSWVSDFVAATAIMGDANRELAVTV